MNPSRGGNAVASNDVAQACDSSVPRTLAAVIADLERRAAEADAIGATAPVGSVYRAAIALLEPLPATPAIAGPVRSGDRLLTVQEAAERMQISIRQVYEDAKHWPFTRKIGHRTLRFSERGLDKWLAARG